MAITAEQLPDGTFRFHGRANDITIQKNKALEPFGKQVLNYGQVLRLLDAGTGTGPEPADRECPVCSQPLSGRADPFVSGKETLPWS